MWAIWAVVCGLLVEGDPHASTDASTAGSAPADVVDRLAHPTDADVAAVDAWWRASNYLTVGQIYLMANPLLREPLASEHIKPRLLGHRGAGEQTVRSPA